jgi:hypothetical protein
MTKYVLHEARSVVGSGLNYKTVMLIMLVTVFLPTIIVCIVMNSGNQGGMV